MVRGERAKVTAVSETYQCAEMQRIALGRGSDLPILLQPSVYWLRSRAFIGFPCPRKIAGIVWLIANRLNFRCRMRLARSRSAFLDCCNLASWSIHFYSYITSPTTV